MVRRQKIVVVILTGLFLASCQAPPPPTGKQMTAAEIQSLVGTTAYGTGPNGQTFILYLAEDGTSRMRIGGISDKGHYRIESSGQFCTQYEKLRNGAERCQTIWKDGDKVISILPDGTISGTTYDRKPGNPENL